jgi:hypothetical protein
MGLAEGAIPVRRPTWTEALLLVLLGGVLGSLLVRSGSAGSAEALAGGGAAGGVIAVAGYGERSDLFYVVDTARQRICVYRWMNPGLRLVSARAYDYDLEIQDTAADKNIEFKGATRGYVKAYVEAARRAGEAKPVKAD